MKLRNRKTGEIIELELIQINDNYLNDHELETIYGEPITLEVLNKYCEDYEPTEPLIDDEEIREIIRPWAKVNCATELKYYEGPNCLEDIFRNEIHFNQVLGLEDGHTYTIEELCGEEEECEN